MYLLVDFLEEEMETVEIMNHFRGLEVIQAFINDSKKASVDWLKTAKMQLLLASIWFFVF